MFLILLYASAHYYFYFLLCLIHLILLLLGYFFILCSMFMLPLSCLSPFFYVFCCCSLISWQTLMIVSEFMCFFMKLSLVKSYFSMPSIRLSALTLILIFYLLSFSTLWIKTESLILICPAIIRIHYPNSSFFCSSFPHYSVFPPKSSLSLSSLAPLLAFHSLNLILTYTALLFDLLAFQTQFSNSIL